VRRFTARLLAVSLVGVMVSCGGSGGGAVGGSGGASGGSGATGTGNGGATSIGRTGGRGGGVGAAGRGGSVGGGGIGTAGRGGSVGGGGVGAAGRGGSVGGGGVGTAGSGGSVGGGGVGAAGRGGSVGSGGATGVAGGSGGAGTTIWRPFADTSAWNTLIPANASVDPNSTTLVTDLSSIAGQTEFWINIQDYSVPVYWVDSTMMPNVIVTTSLGGTGFRTGAANDSVAGGTGPAPIPAGAMAAVGSDRHLAIVDRATRMEWGFWDAAHATGWTAGQAATMDLAGSGARPPERNNPWWAGHGPRACGFALIAGLITVEEMRAGSIEHALVLAYPHIRSRYYTQPASSAQGTTSDALATRGILCGGRVQLDPSLDLSTLGLSASGLIIARALQRYGAFVGDYSGSVSLYADESPDALVAWQGGLLANGEAAKIPLARFRVLTIGTTYDNMN
jgi:hypothetical protein